MATPPPPQEKPTIVLVSGAWCVPAHYSALTHALSTAGFRVHAPTNPTCGGTSARPATAAAVAVSYADDVRHLRAVLAERVEAAGESVVLVMHSYGGAIGTAAVPRSLTAAARRARGLPGGVTHLVYLCAYLLPRHWCPMDVVRQAGALQLLADEVEVAADGGACMLKHPVEALCHDLEDPAERQRQADLLVWFPPAALGVKASDCDGDDGGFEAWREVPATYVRTTEDRCVPPAYQELMLKEVEKSGVEIRQLSLQTSHAVYATKTQEIVKLVEEISGSGGGK
ncbi:hypothetical protein SLS62_000443 [Diatrype stigma]|uniref:AB hydrolase-1 domain-containing protein n=1 Tax=Diatrype stigma TaxID=117547 RepID=A0AAN9YWV9_9PEZI